MGNNFSNEDDKILVEKWAGDKLSLVRSSHNRTYLGKTCFVKCFGERTRFESEIMGQAFCKKYENNIGCIPMLSYNEKEMMVKYALGKACSSFSSFDAGQKAFFLHSNFSHTDKLGAWMSEETLKAQLLYDFFPKLYKLYQQIVRGLYENSHTWVAVHGDIAHHNIVHFDGKDCLIDWEWLALGPREWDFTAVYLIETRHKGMCSVMDMVEGYKSVGGIVELHNIQLMLRLREILSVMYCLKLGKTNPLYKQEAFKRAKSIEENSNAFWQMHF